MKAAKKSTKIKDKPVDTIPTPSEYECGYQDAHKDIKAKLNPKRKSFDIDIENDKGGRLFVIFNVIAQTKFEAIEKAKSYLVFTASAN